MVLKHLLRATNAMQHVASKASRGCTHTHQLHRHSIRLMMLGNASSLRPRLWHQPRWGPTWTPWHAQCASCSTRGLPLLKSKDDTDPLHPLHQPKDKHAERTGTLRCSSSSAASMYPIDPQPNHPQPISLDMSTAESAQQGRELHSLNVERRLISRKQSWYRHTSSPCPAALLTQVAALHAAISANILICVAKVWVHLISGSSAMLAEAFHSVADILNQVLLRVGVLKAMRAPSASHPYGYMRDRFVWSLISAVGIFFLGAGASVFHGLHTLTETRVVEGAMWSYLVLGVSGLLEGYSLLVATRYVMAGAKARGMGLLAYVRSGVDPTTVAVMLEDGGAVAGLAIAAVCTALTHATGSAVWDAIGSIAVGGLLGLIAIFLVQKNRDLLLGRSMSAKEIEEVLGHLRRDPVVLYVTETKTEEIGPRVFRFKADVAWNGDRLVERYLARIGKKRLADRLEAALEAERQAVAAGRGSAGELDAVLKNYGRDIINAVGAEVDRIEVEIQAINPGIRYVDLETDRGRSGYNPSQASRSGSMDSMDSEARPPPHTATTHIATPAQPQAAGIEAAAKRASPLSSE